MAEAEIPVLAERTVTAGGEHRVEEHFQGGTDFNIVIECSHSF